VSTEESGLVGTGLKRKRGGSTIGGHTYWLTNMLNGTVGRGPSDCTRGTWDITGETKQNSRKPTDEVAEKVSALGVLKIRELEGWIMMFVKKVGQVTAADAAVNRMRLAERARSLEERDFLKTPPQQPDERADREKLGGKWEHWAGGA